MKSIFATLIMLTAPLVAEELLDEGLFIPDRDAVGKVEVSAGEIIHRQKATRLKPNRVVFRTDTEDQAKFWLEMELSLIADPGDYYVFMIGGQNYTGFVVRGIDQDHCKWALGFRDADLGRGLLRRIAKVYDLPQSAVEDRTEGEQAGTGQPATRPESKSEGGEKP